ncbi:MAG: hypothetical protein IMZ64_07285 [Bacteroidetes bacterium]|nr:hypothetical protein [Bacteroidota bacterium]
MKSIFFIILSICILNQAGFSQGKENAGIRILFHGLVMDANTLSPLANSQIMINRAFSSVSGNDGTFAFYVNRNDTVVFKSLGYKSTILFVSDTLTGREFIAGIYMNSDTLSIGEVVIVPRLINLKSEIMNAKTKTPATMENARYNVAVSAYQGRNSQNKLGDPASNYELLRQNQKVDAYERGGIPSDKMVGLSPLLLIPAAYLLLHGLPEKPAPLKPQLSDQEVDQIQKKYIETLKQRKE